MKNIKTQLKKGILMVTMFATALSFANEIPGSKIKNDADKTSLTLNDVKIGNLLSIKDNNRITLYKEFIQKNGSYTKGFDLTQLPHGTYTFEVDKDVEIDMIPFTVSHEGVTFNDKNEKVIFKPVTKVVGDLLYVTKLSLDESPLKIDIYFEGNNNSVSSEPIHSEVIENSKIIERVYKLSNIDQGNFEIVCQTEGRTFSKIIQ